MKVEVEEVSSCLRRLSVEVPVEDVRQRVEEAYQELGRKAKVAGFRPGKVPRKILEQYYRKEVERDVLEKIIPETLQKAVEERSLPILGRPKVNPVQLSIEKPIQYTADVEVLPRIEVRGFEDLSFTRRKPAIGEAQVDQALSNLREHHAEFEDVSDAQVSEGDYVVIDFSGTINGELMEKGKGENFPLVVGSGTLLPEFESRLVGNRKGDSVEVTVTYPEEYHNRDLAGKTGIFSVAIKELKKKHLPEINDEFARAVEGEFNTLDELRAKLKESLEREADRQAQADLQGEILDRLIEMNSVEVPAILVEEETRALAREFEQNLKAKGVQMPVGQESQEEWGRHLREQATRRVKGELILERLSEMEGITVSDEEMEKEIEQLASRSRQSIEAARSILAKNQALDQIRGGLKRRKTWDALLGKLKIQDVIQEA